jgi:Fe-S-cluster containining protein
MIELAGQSSRFECRRCGSCCKSTSMIPLTIDDIYRIADFLGMHPDDFFTAYCEEVCCADSVVPMAYLKREKGCPFLADNLCSIHFVKPLLCRYLPSTIFGSQQYLRARMPKSCAIQDMSPGTRVNEDDRVRERYMVSMILTSIYYSTHGTFVYEHAKPYIYRILLINKNRNHLYDFLEGSRPRN